MSLLVETVSSKGDDITSYILTIDNLQIFGEFHACIVRGTTYRDNVLHYHDERFSNHTALINVHIYTYTHT